MIIIDCIWIVAAFTIFWAMIGYPFSLLVLDKLLRRDNQKKTDYEPTVTIMVVAHNEEKVIENKLENLFQLDYPIDKLDIIVASDYSTDRTNEIVERYMTAHPDRHVRLHKSVEHLGKTNAQNEAQEFCDSEILVMTDANAIIDRMAIRELVSYFVDDSISYVSGQLRYTNSDTNKTARSEGVYWRLDLKCRLIESKIQTITAGNGALYAVRNEEYVKIPPIECHDSSFPIVYALKKKRALYNPNAIAYEKAGEVDEDEFGRKVRMNRVIFKGILPDIRILNIYSYHWFSYFYFGHRTCRYLLWVMHLLVLVLNVVLIFDSLFFWKITLGLQLFFYLVAFLGWITKTENKWMKIASYYCMTIIAQWKGVFNSITKKTKSTWEKAETTR